VGNVWHSCDAQSQSQSVTLFRSACLNTPPAYGLSAGPMIVACQVNMSSPAPAGPALQEAGGSRVRSANSFWMRLSADCEPRHGPRRGDMSDGDACMRWRNKGGQTSATDTVAPVTQTCPRRAHCAGLCMTHHGPLDCDAIDLRVVQIFHSRCGHAGRASSQYSPSQKRCFRCTRRLSSSFTPSQHVQQRRVYTQPGPASPLGPAGAAGVA